MNSIRLAALFSLFCLTPAMAQGISASFVAETRLFLQAISKTKTLPANSNLAQGLNLSVFADSSNHASISSSFTHTAQKTVLRWRENGRGQGFLQANVRTGRHTTRLTLKAAQAVQGSLRIQWDWGRHSFGHRGGGSSIVKVAGKTFYFFAPFITSLDRTLPVTVGPQGLTIRNTTGCSGSNSILTGDFDLIMKITFTPRMSCTVLPYGKPCGSSLLGLAYPTREVEVSLSGAYPRANSLLVLGFKRQSFQIPKSPCVLLTKIAFLGPFVTDAGGAARWILPVPPGIAIKFQAQVASFLPQANKLLFRTTNGLEIICRR